MIDYKIVWEKWKDPLGYDEDENNNTIDLENDDEDEFAVDEENKPITFHGKKIRCNIISTPFGIIPINENTASSEIFNFWTGHSNFPISLDIASIIENVDGVETLNVFTKYRFRIAVGKAFVDSEVMRDINRYVYQHLENKYDTY